MAYIANSFAFCCFYFGGCFCMYVVTCTHDGYRTRRRVSGVKSIIRHQNYTSSSISTNTPYADLPYATQYPHPPTFSCLTLVLISYCTLSPCPLMSRVVSDLPHPLGRSPTSQFLTTQPRS